jgi:hypothetical protein
MRKVGFRSQSVLIHNVEVEILGVTDRREMLLHMTGARLGTHPVKPSAGERFRQTTRTLLPSLKPKSGSSQRDKRTMSQSQRPICLRFGCAEHNSSRLQSKASSPTLSR